LLDGGALLLGQHRLVPHGQRDAHRARISGVMARKMTFAAVSWPGAPVASMRVERGDFTSPRGVGLRSTTSVTA
jgi:hypothetical protein